MIIVDSHQHFWDHAELDLPPMPPEVAVLNRAFLPHALAEELRDVGVNYTVCIQPYPQTEACNHWLFRQANASDYVAGVVAWADLTDSRAFVWMLNELRNEPKFVGVRHILEDEPDINWMVRKEVLESFRELARRGVPVDFLVRPRHLPNMLRVLDEVPSLRAVIDHIAKPDIARGGALGWKEDIAAVAQCPTVYCKVSGMIVEADRANWKVADLVPYVEHVVEVFGWDRIMFGSDWPVCLLACSYRQVWEATNEVFRSAEEESKAKVFGANAIHFYNLRI